MRAWIRRTLGIGLAIAAALPSAPITAGQLEPIGPEFQVNAYTIGGQSTTRVSRAGPQFVATWDQYDGSIQGVFGRRLDGSGMPVGAAFQLNTFTIGTQYNPAIAGGDSRFVVVWTSSGQDGDGNGVFGRLFDSNGNPVSVEFQANTYTPGPQELPAVAMDPTGFVVVWRGGSTMAASLFGRRYDLSGAPVAAPFVVSTQTNLDAPFPAVALDGVGNFVVVWDGQTDGDSQGITGRRFAADGNPVAAEFQVNVDTSGNQLTPRLQRNSGGFVVVWRGEGMRGRRFFADGSLAGSEFRVNTFTLGQRFQPAVALGAGGDFVVVWISDDQDGNGQGVFARRFDSDGQPTSGDIQVNSYVTNNQFGADVTVSAGRFVAVWTSFSQDGSAGGVFSRRLRTHEFTLDVDGNGAIAPLTDTLLLLRYAFGFRGATLVTGAIGAGCTRCTAPAIEDYLAGEL